ncbi:serine/threonine protein kinase [Frankia sp. EI5c]|uniref:serine/threonine-protein kinase n=1 Tax=Frankia sp. EI5c TaxID=683316 RepID=UPI0007C27D66|nr:serine/threonine-protein kinase [Frankia sp. EI5c]OAA27137.1 serine/threonine protein kinase [Frankia sp. EI5c]
MINGYRFLRDLGHGGFSTVYLAEQEIFDRQVAVKLLHADLRDPDARRRFVRECRATGRLTGNRNIITVFDAGTTDDHRPYIAMEYLPAGTLRDRLEESGPLPVREMVTLAVPVTQALAAAHRHGILHRDLKPANILLRGPDDPVLSDFGIASFTMGRDAATVSAAFTAGFAAPEVILGDLPAEAADVFGLGATLFALLTKRTPFPGKTPTEIFTRIQAGVMAPLDRPDVPPALENLLNRMLARSPELRPGLDEVTAELGVILDTLDPDATRPASWHGATRPGISDLGTRLAGSPTPTPASQPQPQRSPEPPEPTRRNRRNGRNRRRATGLAVAGPLVLLLAAAALFLLPQLGTQNDAAARTGNTGTAAGTGAAGTAGTPAGAASPPAGASSPPTTGVTGTPGTTAPTSGPTAPAGVSCVARTRLVRDYLNRVFQRQYMCPTDVGSPVFANIGADATDPLDDSGYMRSNPAGVWVICQTQGRDNPEIGGRRSRWWLYTQGDLSRQNAFGYTRAWGYLPASAVPGSGGEALPGVPACPGPL